MHGFVVFEGEPHTLCSWTRATQTCELEREDGTRFRVGCERIERLGRKSRLDAEGRPAAKETPWPKEEMDRLRHAHYVAFAAGDPGEIARTNTEWSAAVKAWVEAP